MSEGNKKVFDQHLANIEKLESLLKEGKKVQQVYKKYAAQPKQFVPQKNVAHWGLMTLPVTWMIFDAFAFWSGYKKVAIGASVFTVALIVFAIVLYTKRSNFEKKKIEEYEHHMEIYPMMEELDGMLDRVKRNLEVYRKMNYSRYMHSNIDIDAVDCPVGDTAEIPVFVKKAMESLDQIEGEIQ